MITELEKTVINDVCKRFFVNKETLKGDSSNKISTWNIEQFESKLDELAIGVEYTLYMIISELFIAEIITKYKWEYHWSDDLEKFIRSNNYFVLYLKQLKERMRLNKMKTDF